jgi:hypothetical protein
MRFAVAAIEGQKADDIVNILLPTKYRHLLDAYFPMVDGQPSLPLDFLDFYKTEKKKKSFSVTVWNLATKVKAHINSHINAVFIRNRPPSGFSHHKFLYLIRFLIFSSHAEKKAIECVSSSLRSKKMKLDLGNAVHRELVDKKQKDYHFDKFWYPDSWLTWLWFGSPEVRIDRRLNMFCIDAVSAQKKLPTQPAFINALGSNNRHEAELARNKLKNTPSNATSPDEVKEKQRVVHVVHSLPSMLNENTASNKIAEHANLLKAYGAVNAEFRRRESELKESSRAGIPISDADEFELQTLRDSLGFHRNSLELLKSEINKLQTSKTTGDTGNKFTTPTN